MSKKKSLPIFTIIFLIFLTLKLAEIGQVAAKLLLEQINNPEQSEQSIEKILKTKLIIRDSS